MELGGLTHRLMGYRVEVMLVLYLVIDIDLGVLNIDLLIGMAWQRAPFMLINGLESFTTITG